MYKEVEKMTNSKKMNPQKLKDTLLKYALYIILLLLLVVIVAIKPNFLSVGNLISILKQASTKGIQAYGVAGIILLAGTDLSVGRVLGLCAAVAASMLQSVTFASRYYPSITEPLPLILPFLVCVAIAVIISAFNGFGMAKLMSDSKAGTTALSYNFTVETDPSNATAALVNGTADIASSSRGLNADEQDLGLTPIVIAHDGIAVIVNPANTIDELSMDQIKSIYVGDITDWGDLA